MGLSNSFNKEEELFSPVAQYFREQEYRVKGEVEGCDLVAINKADEIIIVELKLKFNTQLLYQAVRRLHITPNVYVAIPHSQIKNLKKFQAARSLTRRLNIGLLDVNENSKIVKLIHNPLPFQAKVSKKKREKTLTEFYGRSLSRNKGGITGKKIITAYLEESIKIALALHSLGASKVSTLRKLNLGVKTQSILQNNYYQWFDKVNRGVYSLAPQAFDKIQNLHTDLWNYHFAAIEKRIEKFSKDEC